MYGAREIWPKLDRDGGEAQLVCYMEKVELAEEYAT